MMLNSKTDLVKNYSLVNFENVSYFLLPIKPEYHTDLLPDCILKTEAQENFKKNLSWQNTIENS